MPRLSPGTGALFFAGILCMLGIWRHRTRRAGPMGGWRCEKCHRVFFDLDEAGEKGNGWVAPIRRQFQRDAYGGTVERSGEWPKERVH